MQTLANSTAMIACPVGAEGFITRFCSPQGVWGAVNYSACQQIYCPQEGVWERTLAGLTIPGPCEEDQFGASQRTCSATGAWEVPDYSGCYDKGCLEDGGWATSPIETTLRKPCGAGYTGYFCDGRLAGDACRNDAGHSVRRALRRNDAWRVHDLRVLGECGCHGVR